MNEKEISEIRRRYKQEKSGITHISGCYVNSQGEIVSEFSQSLGIMPPEEGEKFLAILKKTMSGKIGKNLNDINFSVKEVMENPEHKLLMTLRSSELKDEEAIGEFYQKVIGSVEFEGSYLILLAYDTYDIPYRSGDGVKQEDASSEVYSYFLCCVCPVKQQKPALSYYVQENEFHSSKSDWIVSAPELGFVFPAFDDRRANIYNTLYYTRNTSDSYDEFVKAVFNTEVPMPATVQKETFESILNETLEDECSMELVAAVHDEFYDAIEAHKESREEEPLVVTRASVKSILQSCGVAEARVEAFDERFDEEFGDRELRPGNLVDTNRVLVKTPDVTITVNPQKSELIDTRIIDGKKYILIRAVDGVEVNGVSVNIKA